VSYLAEIKTGWTVLSTFQYVIHPGGGYVFDNGVPWSVANTAVFGMRSISKF
jgi:porin